MDRNPRLVPSPMDSALVFERASATPTVRRRSAETREGRPSTVPSGVAPLSLAAQQRWFQTVVTHRDSVAAGAVIAGAAVDRVIAPGAQISAADGLAVYHHAYAARLTECLVDDYPALHHALGEECFAALATRYIVQYPSESRNLNAFGRHMEGLCREQAHPRAGFWADLARLEWALVEILHAEDAPPLAVEELSAIPPEAWPGAQLLQSETLRVCRFDYPINAYFQAFKQDEAPGIPDPTPTALAVYRQGFTLWRMVLTPAMADLLEDLLRGVTLGDALGAMEGRIQDPEALAEVASHVMAWFSSWVRGGFFRSVTPRERSFGDPTVSSRI